MKSINHLLLICALLVLASIGLAHAEAPIGMRHHNRRGHMDRRNFTLDQDEGDFEGELPDFIRDTEDHMEEAPTRRRIKLPIDFEGELPDFVQDDDAEEAPTRRRIKLPIDFEGELPDFVQDEEEQVPVIPPRRIKYPIYYDGELPAESPGHGEEDAAEEEEEAIPPRRRIKLPIDFEGELPDFVQDEADEEPANNDDDDDHHEQEDEEYVLPDINNANRWILGHRGNSWDYPQNTLQAFQSCVDLGCDCNEMDLRRTKDGVLVVFHDASVDSVTNGKGKVNTYTFAELQKLDAGYRFTRDGGKTYPFRGKGYKIPSLAQVFSKIKKGYFNMDMKDDDSRVPQELYNLIRSHGVANRSIVGSFIDRNTEAFRKIAPSIQSLATAKEATAFAAAFHKGDNAAACRAVSASNWQDLPTHLTKNWPAYIKLSHQCKNKVAFWTINDTATMEKLLKDGADGIITDKVAEAARLFRRLGYKK